MEFDYRAREAQLSKVLGRVVFDLAGDDPGSLLLTIAKLRDATEACEAKYARMVSKGASIASHMEQLLAGAAPARAEPPAAGQRAEPRKRGAPRGPRGPRQRQPAERPAPPEPPPAPLFADQTARPSPVAGEGG